MRILGKGVTFSLAQIAPKTRHFHWPLTELWIMCVSGDLHRNDRIIAVFVKKLPAFMNLHKEKTLGSISGN
jgi:hypothetical protein